MTIPSITAQDYCEQFPEDCQYDEFGFPYDDGYDYSDDGYFDGDDYSDDGYFDYGNPNNFNYYHFTVPASIEELKSKTPNAICQENIITVISDCIGCQATCDHDLQVVLHIDDGTSHQFYYGPENYFQECNEVLPERNFKPFLNKDHVEIEKRRI